MAESTNSLIQFDSILMDVNENPSHTEYQQISHVVEQHESLPSKVESPTFDNNLTLCESSDYSQPTINSFEMSQTVIELQSDKLNSFVQNANEVSNHKDSDTVIQNAENALVDNEKIIDITSCNLNLSNGFEVLPSDFSSEDNNIQYKDEEFHDAVQFFKDPSSFNFLENAGSTNATESFNNRSSLYMNFDPLHAKFNSQTTKKPSELEEISEDDVPPELQVNVADNHSDPVVRNKHLVVGASPRQSIGNILISFDSPVTNKNTDSETAENVSPSEPPKLYTEEEFHQALKIQELTVQETFLKRQHDLELERMQKLQDMEAKMEKQNFLSSSLHQILKEAIDIACTLSNKNKDLQASLENAEKEHIRLKEDIKTSGEDLQSVESTFSDFHKRYEQCKGMLKTYIQNEDSLKQQLENQNVKLQEKDEMYKALQSRTEEMVDKANMEVANAKKTSEAQVAVLKAQLKKAELKISSLESDVKHVKIENGKLSSICDDLMAKVSEEA